MQRDLSGSCAVPGAGLCGSLRGLKEKVPREGGGVTVTLGPALGLGPRAGTSSVCMGAGARAPALECNPTLLEMYLKLSPWQLGFFPPFPL